MKLFFASIVFLVSICCFSLSHASDSILVSNSTIQIPMVKGRPAKGSVVLKNNSLTDDVLIEIMISKARRVEIHESYMEKEVSKMRKVGGLALKASNKLIMEESGYHLMVFDLDSTIVVGDKITGKLVFQVAGEIEVEFEVIKLNINSHKMH